MLLFLVVLVTGRIYTHEWQSTGGKCEQLQNKFNGHVASFSPGLGNLGSGLAYSLVKDQY